MAQGGKMEVDNLSLPLQPIACNGRAILTLSRHASGTSLLIPTLTGRKLVQNSD